MIDSSCSRRSRTSILGPLLVLRKGQIQTDRRGQIHSAPREVPLLLSLREATGPLHRRVYLALKAKIRDGGLGPAARVPSTRAFARDLGVSRNTVMLAYEQLAAEGYLVSRQRGTTSVAGVVPSRIAPAPLRPKLEAAPRLSA